MLTPATRSELATGDGNYAGIAFAAVLAAYFLGAIPAALAGAAHPSLRRWLSPGLAALATGALGTGAYLLTFGAHLPGIFSFSELMKSAILPSFFGVAVPAYLIGRYGNDA